LRAAGESLECRPTERVIGTEHFGVTLQRLRPSTALF
jgi:hypothetical protein